MITKEIDAKALTEVYYIISNLEEKYRNKIPEDVKKNIVKFMDRDYEYTDDTEILPEAKALLAVIIEKYFEDTEFNEKLRKYNMYYEIKTNEIKEKKYSIDEIFSKNNKRVEDEYALVDITKDKWYKRFFNLFRNFFKKHID